LYGKTLFRESGIQGAGEEAAEADGGRGAGEAHAAAAVDIFYGKVLKDDRIKGFFDGVDLAKQKAFLAFAFGGPAHCSGKNMRDGHAHLVKRGLIDSHVDAVIENLGATLKELKVADDLIAEVAKIANSVRSDVLGR
jgi:hemoglobin